MAFELAKAFVTVSTRTGLLKSGLNSAHRLVQGSISRLTGLISGLGIGTGIGASFFGASAVKTAADAEELKSLFNVVFGAGAREAEKFAETLVDKVGGSVLDTMEQMAGFQDTFVPLGFARDEARQLSQRLVALTRDVSSFKNLAPDDVANRFTSALVGNNEAVRALGIVLTAATLDQELLNMGIQGGAKAATQQQKVMARLNIILRSTTDAHGDAERTAGSFTNRMRDVAGQLKDIQAVIGTAVLPAFTKMANSFAIMLKDNEEELQSFADGFGDTVSLLVDNWDVAMDIIGTSAAIKFTEISQGLNEILRQARKLSVILFTGTGGIGPGAAAPPTQQALNTRQKQLEQIDSDLKKDVANLTSLREHFGRLQKQIGERDDNEGDNADATKDNTDALEGLSTAMKLNQESFQKLLARGIGFGAQPEGLLDEITKEESKNRTRQAGTFGTKQIFAEFQRAALEKQQKPAEEQVKEQKKTNQILRVTKDEIRKFNQGMARNFFRDPIPVARGI